MVDKTYCASSYLMYRTVIDEDKIFYPGVEINRFHKDFSPTPVTCADDLLDSIEKQVNEWTKDGKAALALSGGVDSAIIAKFMPKGSTAYTFQCIVPGVEVTNEVPQAAEFAEICGLKQKVIPIYWEDFETYTPLLAKHKGAPFHSIEVQIYKAALQAKSDGFEKLIFAETADTNYGGFSGLMSKDWTFGEFVDRYSYVKPYQVLKDWEMPLEPYIEYTKPDGYIDAHEFQRNVFLTESMGTYTNACQSANIEMCSPFVHTYMAVPMDYERIRAGENKYIVREAFQEVYKDFPAPEKVPMPRPTNEWFKDWEGPTRPEFWPHCTDHMTGDQKWLVWCLEQFFNLMEG